MDTMSEIEAQVRAQARELYQAKLAGKNNHELLDMVGETRPENESYGLSKIAQYIKLYEDVYLAQDKAEQTEAEAKKLDLARIDRFITRIEDAFVANQVGPGLRQTPLPAMVNALVKLLKHRETLIGHGAPRKLEGTFNVNHTLGEDTKSVDAELQELADKLGISNIVDAEVVPEVEQ